MAEINSVEYEHRLTNMATENGHEQEHEVQHPTSPAHTFAPTTLRSPAMRNSVNSPDYREAMLGAQRTYGNRAVQRCLQHGRGRCSARSGALTTSVQRFQGPDSDWWKTTGGNAAGGVFNTIAAIPGIGNGVSAFTAGGTLTASTIAGLMGEEQEAKKLRHASSYFGMHAIPGFGNALAAKHAAQDWGAFGENLAGRQAENSAQSWERDTAPHIDQLLGSLF